MFEPILSPIDPDWLVLDQWKVFSETHLERCYSNEELLGSVGKWFRDDSSMLTCDLMILTNYNEAISIYVETVPNTGRTMSNVRQHVSVSYIA